MNKQIALIGFGKIAQEKHQPALSSNPAFELSAVVDPHLGTDASARTPRFSSFKELLASQVEIDAVALCVPPRQRYSLARQAISAGLHVLLEKPPGATLSEVDDLKQQAACNGVTLYASWHSRHAPGIKAARDWLSGRRVNTVEINWLEDVTVFHPNQTWIWEPGGLGVFDPGINALSIATDILPDTLVLNQARLGVPENCKTPIVAELVFSSADATTVHASMDWRHKGQPRWDISVKTDMGELLLENGGEQLRIDDQVRINEPADEYAGVYATFAALIDKAQSEVDLRPFKLVADALLLGDRYAVEAFHET